MRPDVQQLPLDFDQPARLSRIAEATAIIAAMGDERAPEMIASHAARLRGCIRPRGSEQQDVLTCLVSLAYQKANGQPMRTAFWDALVHDALLYAGRNAREDR